MRDEPVLKRRTFLSSSLAAAGAGVLVSHAAARQDKEGTSSIPTRKFGKTGLTLPVLGMGGSAFVALWVKSYGAKLLGTEDRIAMVRKAYDCGIRYFDTARVYGESEMIFGRGLKEVRDQVFLASKVAVMDPAQVRQSVETSLKNLDTGYLDLIQVHSPVIEKLGFEGGMKVHAELLKLRDQKMVRYIGLTTHVAFETVCKMIDTGGFDQVLLANGYFNRGMDTLLSHRNLQWRELCLAKAADRGMAIVAMKVMGLNVLGHNAKNLVPDYDPSALARLPGAAIRWVLQDDRIAMLNIGVSLPEDIDRNLATLRGDLKFTNADRALLADYCQRAYEAEAVKKMQIVQRARHPAGPPLC
jgi:aryl-alcohol dehydrogenase-like predicted oxidoreductase